NVQAERHPRMARNDRVVHLEALVEQLVRIAAASPVTFPQIVVEQGRVLWRVDLDVGAAETAELRDLAASEVHDVGEVCVTRWIGVARLLRVVVGSCLLGRYEG